MNPPAAAPRRPRWPWIAGLLVVGIVMLLLLVRWAAQPQRATGFLLQRAGDALGLQITATGTAEYRLRGSPQLVVRGVTARQPGAREPVLTAKRLLLALPWSTVKARGADLTVTRIELDAPVFNLPAFQAWQATRPPSQTRIPTLTRGLAIKDGRIDNDDWVVDRIDLQLPSLAPDQPLTARVQARYKDPPIRIDTVLDVAMSRPAADAGVGVIGALDVIGEDWSLPSWIRLSGYAHLGADELRMVPAKLAMRARYVSNNSDVPFRLGVYGPVHFDDAVLRLQRGAVALRGKGTIPTADAIGDVALGRSLRLQLEGRIARWPEAWPALPSPIAQSSSPLPFALRYDGATDFSDVAGLSLRRDATTFDARFKLPQVTDWIDAKMQPSPLPPLAGTLSTPRLEIAGAQLEGVELSFDDPALPAPVR